jgi:hypothetical protein
MSKLTHRPILHVNGSGFQNLYEQYSATLRSLEESERFACAAFPHGRDYHVSSDPNLTEKAREEYRLEVVAKIVDAKNYIHDLLIDIITQNTDREARRARHTTCTNQGEKP